MQSLCIISVRVINIGIQSRFAILQSVTNQDNFLLPYFLNNIAPTPSKSQVHRTLPEQRRGEEEEKEEKLIGSHTPHRGDQYSPKK